MNPWTILELALGVIGAGLAIVGQKLSQPILSYAGIAVLGLVTIVIGLEAMVKRRVVLPSRYYRYASETYVGLAAFAQGVLFILMGTFLSGVSILAYLNTGRSVFQHFVRHPGLPLLIFGVSCFMAAIVAVAGYAEQRQGPKWVVFLELLTSRLLGGLILIAIAVAATGLGLLEVVAPQTFDQMGGGFLEVLFGT
jgi:hypothetical protein